MVEEEHKQMSPSIINLGRDTPSKDSSARKSIVPPLNLSKLDLSDKNAQLGQQ